LNNYFTVLNQLVDDGLLEVRNRSYELVAGKTKDDIPDSTKLRTKIIKYIGKAIKS
jgi:hypothetical protein